jgi:phospholipid/cholesterol/gamma-HCH transport system ATP-binding protein
MDLSKKLSVTSVVVTHEMDSAFRIADRMVMLEKGRVLRIASRVEFEAIRDAVPEDLPGEDERLIHQFLNGATDGPLTDADGASEYEAFMESGEV